MKQSHSGVTPRVYNFFHYRLEGWSNSLKRILILILAIVIAFPAAIGIFLYASYRSIDESAVPDVSITVMDKTVELDGYEWYAPVFGGLLYKDLYRSSEGEVKELGTLEGVELSIETPGTYTGVATLTKGDTQIWTGSADDISRVDFVDSGEYRLDVSCEKYAESGKGYGILNFAASFWVAAPPRIEASADGVEQGDVLAIRLYNLDESVEPTAKADLGGYNVSPVFTPEVTADIKELGVRNMTAYIPVSYEREPGNYTVVVQAGKDRWDLSVTVLQADFPRQDLTIDTWSAEVSEASSWWAYEEFNSKVPPLYTQSEAKSYWKGDFVMPVEGKINTEYGLFRYTNGDPTPERHAGIDIDGETGDPVAAPNDGKVMMAEMLLNTGNTIILDHGNGLKSYFYHMDSLNVAVGDKVKKGDQLGTVGTTGYSTGAHLHYEVRIGADSIDPMRLFDGKGGLLYFE